MRSRVQTSTPFSTCRGSGIWLTRTPPAVNFRSSPGWIGRSGDSESRGLASDHQWQVATALAELEAEAGAIPVLEIRLARREDLGWAEAVMTWGAAHGRRLLLRSSLALPRSVVACAAEVGATVLVQIAHGRPDVQQALLGPHADGAATLLLRAQYLRTKGVPVAVHLGPLLPGIHDRGSVIPALARHVVAAEIRNAHLGVGGLGPVRLEALEQVCGRELGQTLRRAFRVEDSVRTPPPWRLPSSAYANLFHGVRRHVEAEGLHVDRCGCTAQCHLDPGRTSHYVPVAPLELFGSAS